MSNEPFNPEKFKAVSVTEVFAHPVEGARPFSARMQNRFQSVENSHLTPDGEPTMLLQMSQMASSGISLRAIGAQFGLTHKLVGELLQSAGIPYLSRAEAIQKLWQDEKFRQKNGAAVEKGFEQFLGDEERKAQKADKLRAANIARFEDPEERRLASEKAKKQFEDPEQRKSLSERQSERMADPVFRALHSEKATRQWQDGDFRETVRDSASRNLAELWRDPEFRAAAIERSRQSMLRLRQNPDYLERGAEASRQTRRSPEYGAQRREIALALWQNPDYRSRLSQIHTDLWQDPDYRQMIMQALRTARLDPANRDRYYLPTIQGFRPDIGFHAQSTWEANVARVFQHVGRQYEIGVTLPLVVTDQFRDIFDSPEVAFSVDFATTDRRGSTALYEIMAHPLEDPDGWAKFLMAQEQFPNLNLRAIDQPYYQTLKSRYETRINADPNLLGWEKDGFNLRTHPEVFASQ